MYSKKLSPIEIIYYLPLYSDKRKFILFDFNKITKKIYDFPLDQYNIGVWKLLNVKDEIFVLNHFFFFDIITFIILIPCFINIFFYFWYYLDFLILYIYIYINIFNIVFILVFFFLILVLLLLLIIYIFFSYYYYSFLFIILLLGSEYKNEIY